ncbi:hypothetical protein F8154_06675 [Alkaliphilus pronyensis]|uniref:Endonuclease/exonuclease/phosphatase domain-containing protein n=1 Tax=Alkaliphilus pronyensis TaxID=1482732 RepID=A0A6I0F0B8_9FIRM|nr:endonuclease/exonuclease/phosphatase family protein [Alkaliphilus pronyensis]KAB3535347.1 hypothetical protein F8154_06675 [Alkaliphilus pronyensis]
MRKQISFMVLVIMIMSGLVIKASSQGEIDITKYLINDQLYYLEIKTPYEVKDIIIEAIDPQNEIVNYSVLRRDFYRKSEEGSKYNIFYITNKMTNLNKISKIRLYSKGNKEIKYNIEELDGVYLETPTLEASTNKEVTNLRVMTYNIHHGKSLLGRDTLKDILALIRESDADIIGIQEVDNGVYRSKFRNQIKYLAENLSMYYAYGDNFNYFGGKYGNGVISKYPIVNYENILLPSKSEQRGLLSTTIDLGSERIQFMVTHLGLYKSERREQIETIKKHMDTVPYEKILVGDFNSTQDTGEISSLSKTMLDTGYVSGNNHQPTYDLSIVSGRIDYLFISPSLQLNQYNVIKSRASDHYPAVIDIELPQ